MLWPNQPLFHSLYPLIVLLLIGDLP